MAERKPDFFSLAFCNITFDKNKIAVPVPKTWLNHCWGSKRDNIYVQKFGPNEKTLSKMKEIVTWKKKKKKNMLPKYKLFHFYFQKTIKLDYRMGM